MMKIVCVIDHYLPGYKAGGPIRTMANMVEKLGEEFEFRIVPRDRDSGDSKPYPGIKVDNWNRVGKAEVFYMSPKIRSLSGFKTYSYDPFERTIKNLEGKNLSEGNTLFIRNEDRVLERIKNSPRINIHGTSI